MKDSPGPRNSSGSSKSEPESKIGLPSGPRASAVTVWALFGLVLWLVQMTVVPGAILIVFSTKRLSMIATVQLAPTTGVAVGEPVGVAVGVVAGEPDRVGVVNGVG